MTSLNEIALSTLDGRPTTLAELADGAALVVNVASKCGLTPQYTALEQLAKDYGDRGLTVIAGLPYLRVSPVHGTAFDIAGKGIASPSNLIAALQWASTRSSSPHDWPERANG